MEKKKVLIVTQEMEPYTALSEIAAIARKLPSICSREGNGDKSFDATLWDDKREKTQTT